MSNVLITTYISPISYLKGRIDLSLCLNRKPEEEEPWILTWKQNLTFRIARSLGAAQKVTTFNRWLKLCRLEGKRTSYTIKWSLIFCFSPHRPRFAAVLSEALSTTTALCPILRGSPKPASLEGTYFASVSAEEREARRAPCV